MVHCHFGAERESINVFNEIRLAHFEKIVKVWETKQSGWCRSLVLIKQRVQYNCPSEVNVCEKRH